MISTFCLDGTKAIAMEALSVKDANNNEKVKGNCKTITAIEGKRIIFSTSMYQALG